MTQSSQITLSAELESLPKFREQVKSTCRDALTGEALYDLQLAVDELCTNIIMHGYKDMDPGSVVLNVDVEKERVVVEITDFGHAFEPAEPPAPDPLASVEEREVGGLGLFFVHMSVDDIQYESAATGNVTRIIKRIR
ncbi:MAG: ATP-binding protein [Chloroflexi bacterium]|nr:ATP-binding protein [Chloroflexota bacterium]